MASLSPALVFVVGALAMAVVPRRPRTVLVVAVPLAALAWLVSLDTGTAPTVGLYGYELVPLRVDGLAVAFGVVFVLAALLAGLYGLRTMGAGEQALAFLYAGSALGAVLAGDLITFFVFWELKVVGSAALVWAGRRRRSGAAGMRYLLVHVTGGTVLLAGIVWHVSQTGSLAFTAFAPGPAATLVLLGLAVSAAIPPLHAWLPDTYPEASVAGTVFLSAFTTKAAVYALARGFAGYEVLVWVGVAMALYGVVYAVLENDIRRLLAYHIVSQVGYMVAAVGIGTAAAINGATAHAFAHILYKGLLLMGAGAVLHATARSRLTELGGLARAMPAVVVLYFVGAFSISGVPLFSGFVSKELVVEAARIDGREAVVYLLKLASVGTFLHTGLKLPYFTWFGPRRDLRPTPVPASMYVAMGLTAAINVAIGVHPGLLYELLPFAVDYQPYSVDKLVEITQLLVLTGMGFWLLLDKLGGEPTITLDTDWLYRGLPGRVGAAAGLLGAPVARGSGAVRTLRRWSRAPAPAGRDAGQASRPPLLPLWVLGAVVVGTFVAVLAWSLVA